MSALVLGGLSYKTADAQIGIHVNLHFGTPVVEATPVATVAYDDYYYLPDVDAYYSVAEQCYYYFDGDEWIAAAYLPGYQNYDWRSSRRFEIRGTRPYMRNDYYRSKFGGEAHVWGGARMDHDRFANRGWSREGEMHQQFNHGWGERGRMQEENHGGWNQQHGGEQYNGNRGGWNQGGQQPQHNQGYNQGQQEQGHAWGGNNNQGQSHGQWGGQQQGGQPSQNFNQGQQGGGHTWGGQPANQQNGGGNRGNFGGGQHFTQNRMSDNARPARF